MPRTLMVESPWRGTPNSPLILLETPYRQLVPFSPFDVGLSDANMLITAKSGGGKTFIAQMFLTMMARLNPLHFDPGARREPYRPLVELMGGRCIDVNLEGAETLNASGPMVNHGNVLDTEQMLSDGDGSQGVHRTAAGDHDWKDGRRRCKPTICAISTIGISESWSRRLARSSRRSRR